MILVYVLRHCNYEGLEHLGSCRILSIQRTLNFCSGTKGSKIQSLGFRVWFRVLGPRASEDEYIADSLTFNKMLNQMENDHGN